MHICCTNCKLLHIFPLGGAYNVWQLWHTLFRLDWVLNCICIAWNELSLHNKKRVNSIKQISNSNGIDCFNTLTKCIHYLHLQFNDFPHKINILYFPPWNACLHRSFIEIAPGSLHCEQRNDIKWENKLV